MLIDAHSHFYPVGYLNFLKKQGKPPHLITRAGVERLVMYPDQSEGSKPKGARITPDSYDVAAKIEYMEEYSVDRSILSLGNPWLDFCPADQGARLAAQINDDLAEICAQHPQHFWNLACLPASDVQASINELHRLAKRGATSGVLMSTHLNGYWVDEEAASPFWACVEELQFPIYLHPFHSPAGETVAAFDDMLRFSLAFPFETALAAARLILSGTMDRFPGVKIILAHAGGVLPALAGRLDAYTSSSTKEKLAKPVRQYLNNFYYDALTYSPEVLRMLISQVGCERLIFGTDHPYSANNPRQLWNTLNQAQLGEQELELISSRNAVDLFRLS